jgi:hypothetical protein
LNEEKNKINIKIKENEIFLEFQLNVGGSREIIITLELKMDIFIG